MPNSGVILEGCEIITKAKAKTREKLRNIFIVVHLVYYENYFVNFASFDFSRCCDSVIQERLFFVMYLSKFVFIISFMWIAGIWSTKKTKNKTADLAEEEWSLSDQKKKTILLQEKRHLKVKKSIELRNKISFYLCVYNSIQIRCCKWSV